MRLPVKLLCGQCDGDLEYWHDGDREGYLCRACDVDCVRLITPDRVLRDVVDRLRTIDGADDLHQRALGVCENRIDAYLK